MKGLGDAGNAEMDGLGYGREAGRKGIVKSRSLNLRFVEEKTEKFCSEICHAVLSSCMAPVEFN